MALAFVRNSGGGAQSLLKLLFAVRRGGVVAAAGAATGRRRGGGRRACKRKRRSLPTWQHRTWCGWRGRSGFYACRCGKGAPICRQACWAAYRHRLLCRLA